MNDQDGRIDDELREAGAEWRSKRLTPEGALNPHMFESVPSRAGGRRRAMASVAGVGALLLIVGLLVVTLPPPDQHVATGSSSPSASARPTSSNTDIHWQRIGAPSIPAITDGFDSVVASGGRFVGQAHRCEAGATSCEYMLLDSPDGSSWSVTASITVDNDEARQVQILHDDRLGYVAIGRMHQGPGAAIWQSSDGRNWQALGDDPAFDAIKCGAGDSRATDLSAIYAVSGKLIAVGSVGCSNVQTTVGWISDDGRVWNQMAGIPVAGIVSHDGAYVGVQQASVDDVLLKSSPDGLTWNLVNLPVTPLTVAAVSTGFVGLGRSLDAGVVVLVTSTDGITWQVHEAPQFARVAGPLSSDGQRAALVDRLANPLDSLWISSPDGLRWTHYRVPDAGSFGLDGVAILGNRAVAWSATAPYLWIGDVPPTSAAPTPTPAPSLVPTPSAQAPETPHAPPPTPMVHATLSPDAAGWVNEVDPGFGYVDQFYSSATNRGLTVVSGESTAGPDSHSFYWATWSTHDGVNWRQSDIWPVQLTHFSWIELAGFGEGFAAFAQVDDLGGPNEETYVYLSPDGDQWTLTAILNGVQIRSAVRMGGSLVATGLDADFAGSIWLSADAVNWHRSNDPAAASATLWSQLGAYGSRVVLLDPLADQVREGADIWFSDDAGETWSQARTPAVSKGSGAAIGRLAAGPAGWVAAGWFGGDTGGDFSWWSRDGSEWQKATTTPQGVKTVVGYYGGFIAGGYHSTYGGANAGPGQGMTWISSDGLAWRQLASDGWQDQKPQVLAISGGTLLGLTIDPASDTVMPGGLWLANLDTFGQ